MTPSHASPTPTCAVCHDRPRPRARFLALCAPCFAARWLHETKLALNEATEHHARAVAYAADHPGGKLPAESFTTGED